MQLIARTFTAPSARCQALPAVSPISAAASRNRSSATSAASRTFCPPAERDLRGWFHVGFLRMYGLQGTGDPDLDRAVWFSAGLTQDSHGACVKLSEADDRVVHQYRELP